MKQPTLACTKATQRIREWCGFTTEPEISVGVSLAALLEYDPPMIEHLPRIRQQLEQQSYYSMGDGNLCDGSYVSTCTMP
jgi:hypothetical protein